MSTVFAKLDKRTALVIFFIVLFSLSGGCTANKPVVNDASNGQQLLDSKRITEITASEDESSYLVLVNGNRQLTYTSVKQNLPLGILFYFQDTQIDSNIEPLVITDNEIIESIEVSPINDKQDMSRLLISLKQDIPYDVTADGNGIRISFAKPLGDKITDEANMSSDPVVAEPIPEVTPTTEIASRIKGIDIQDTENLARINVTADGAIKDFKIFTLDKPARIVVRTRRCTQIIAQSPSEHSR